MSLKRKFTNFRNDDQYVPFCVKINYLYVFLLSRKICIRYIMNHTEQSPAHQKQAKRKDIYEKGYVTNEQAGFDFYIRGVVFNSYYN